MLQLDHRKIQAVGSIVKESEARIQAETGLAVRLEVNGTPSCDVLIVETVIQTICNVVKISPIAVLGKSRETAVAWARHIACWYLVSMCELQEKTVAEHINRDRTTVMNSVNVTTNLLAANDSEFTPIFQACISALSTFFKKSDDEI